jgi:branched-chain amino acid transport system substrate-binding protein
MSRPNKPTIVAAAVLGAALLAAPVPALAQAASSAPAGGSIRLGAAGPISGGSAAFGLQFKEGVEQAVADINHAGGILGQKVTLVRST